MGSHLPRTFESRRNYTDYRISSLICSAKPADGPEELGAQDESMFKKCSLCTREWSSRDDFLNDPENHFEGYVYLKRRALDGIPVEGLLLFTHCHAQCGTTLAIAASRFRSEEGRGT